MYYFTEDPEETNSRAGKMTYDNFDLEKILLEGNHLVGSEGIEFELDTKEEGTSERLASQKAALNATLGFSGVSDTVEGLITDEDLIMAPNQEKNIKVRTCLFWIWIYMKFIIFFQQSVASIVQNASCPDGLSSREMNRAKRVARLVAKQRSKETLDDDSAPESKKSKLELKQEEEKDLIKAQCVTEDTSLWEEVQIFLSFNIFCICILFRPSASHSLAF